MFFCPSKDLIVAGLDGRFLALEFSRAQFVDHYGTLAAEIAFWNKRHAALGQYWIHR